MSKLSKGKIPKRIVMNSYHPSQKYPELSLWEQISFLKKHCFVIIKVVFLGEMRVPKDTGSSPDTGNNGTCGISFLRLWRVEVVLWDVLGRGPDHSSQGMVCSEPPSSMCLESCRASCARQTAQVNELNLIHSRKSPKQSSDAQGPESFTICGTGITASENSSPSATSDVIQGVTTGARRGRSSLFGAGPATDPAASPLPTGSVSDIAKNSVSALMVMCPRRTSFVHATHLAAGWLSVRRHCHSDRLLSVPPSGTQSSHSAPLSSAPVARSRRLPAEHH